MQHKSIFLQQKSPQHALNPDIPFSLYLNRIIHELSVISSPGPLFLPSESISAPQIDVMRLAFLLEITIHNVIYLTISSG